MNLAVGSLAFAWCLALLVAATGEAPGSPYDYPMAYNEYWYGHVNAGDWADPFLPPLFVWIAHDGVFASLRLVSFLSGIGLVALGVRYLGEGALGLASLPWLFAWGFRAHTDTLMVALTLGGVLLARLGGRGFLGGFLVGLSAFAKPPGLLGALGLPLGRPRVTAGFLLGLVPFLAWALTRSGDVWAFHAGSSVLFGNWALNFLGIVLGAGFLLTPRVLSRVRLDSWLAVPGLAFLAWALLKAPLGHEYYLLPGLAFLALTIRDVPEWVVVGNSLLGSLLMVWFLV